MWPASVGREAGDRLSLLLLLLVLLILFMAQKLNLMRNLSLNRRMTWRKLFSPSSPCPPAPAYADVTVTVPRVPAAATVPRVTLSLKPILETLSFSFWICDRLSHKLLHR